MDVLAAWDQQPGRGLEKEEDKEDTNGKGGEGEATERRL